MRKHLIECIESRTCSNFLFSVNTNWREKRIVSSKENLFCVCRGIHDSVMVQCIACQLWYHLRCISKSARKSVENDRDYQYRCIKC